MTFEKRWGQSIVKGCGVAYAKDLLQWWETDGTVIHGKELANLKIAALKAAIDEAQEEAAATRFKENEKERKGNHGR